MIPIEWRVYEAGHCVHPEWPTRRGAPVRKQQFPALVSLLRHPTEGYILFDTGYSQHFHEATKRMPERLYSLTTPVHLGENESVREQLAKDKINPDDVCLIILSHLHGDHVGGVADFPHASVALSKKAWRAMRAQSRIGALRVGVLPALMDGRSEHSMRWFEDLSPHDMEAPFDQFGRGFDLFGDRSIMLVELPGHAPGHFGIVFHDSKGPVFLVADASWSSQAIRDNTPPPWVTTAWLSETALCRDTLTRLHRLHRAAPHVRLVPSHCREWRPEGCKHA